MPSIRVCEVNSGSLAAFFTFDMNNIFSPTIFDAEAKVWRGPSRPEIFGPTVSAGRVGLFNLSQNPDLVCQINCSTGAQKTNRQIHDETLSVAASLRKLGCRQGDVVGFIARNNDSVAAAVLAAFLLAAPINALDPTFAIQEIIHMFGITKPKFVFCESDKVPVLREALQVLKNDAKIIVFGDRLADSLHIEDFLADPGDLGAFSPPEVDDDTCAVIFCSSGTTGLPKGVCINHRNLNFIAAYGYTDDEVEKPYKILTFTSIYWVTAVLTLLVGLGRSTRLIVPESYSDDFFYKIIKKYRPEIIFTGPMYFEGLINHPSIQVSDLDSIKVYICGGSVVSQALWEKSKVFLRNGELRCAYGMSEISFISKAPPKASKRSEGYILSGQQVRILDEDGENLGVGEQGEICIKWQHMFRGYFDNPEATAKVLDADGWLHSGDIGFFDQDNQLHVMGRSKDLIEYNYFKITPGEIENVILSVPGVRQAVVVGVPDPKFVDLPAAVVIRKEGSSVTEQDIAAAIEARLSDHKRLRGGIYFVDSVPTTPSGKVKKQLVKENVVKLYREKQQGI